MSASIESSAIFLKDTPKQILNKMNRYAFSGGQETAEQQRELGANPDVDVAYQYLRFFLEVRFPPSSRLADPIASLTDFCVRPGRRGARPD